MNTTVRPALAALTALSLASMAQGNAAWAQGTGQSSTMSGVGTPSNSNPSAPEVIPNTGMNSAGSTSVRPNTGMDTGANTRISPNTGSNFGTTTPPLTGQPRSVPFPETNRSNKNSGSFYRDSDAGQAGTSANIPAPPAQTTPIQNPGMSGLDTSRSRAGSQPGFVSGLSDGISGPLLGVTAGMVGSGQQAAAQAPNQKIVVQNTTVHQQPGKITVHVPAPTVNIVTPQGRQGVSQAAGSQTSFPLISEVAGSTGMIAGVVMNNPALATRNGELEETMVSYDRDDADDDDATSTSQLYWAMIAMLLLVGGALAAFIGLNWRRLNRPNRL